MTEKDWGDRPSIDKPMWSSSPGAYGDHVSCFLEPVPLDIIARCFNHKNPFWKSGSVVYQHVFKIKKEHLPFQVLEVPEKTEMYYDPSVDDDEYFARLTEIYATIYKGTTLADLERIAKHLKGSVRKQYSLLKTRPNAEKLMQKYAATVPHVALYPKGGVIELDSVTAVTVK